MSRKLTCAEEVFLRTLAVEAPDAFSHIAREFVPPTNMASVGSCITQTAPVTEPSVRIQDSYIGQKYGNEEGLFLGYFDLGNGVGEKPIFIVELTKKDMTFSQTVQMAGELPNGYVADPYPYDSRQGLREGKTVIAPFDMVMAAYKEQNRFEEAGKNGKTQKMFKDAGWVLTSSPYPGSPNLVRIVIFRDGDNDWFSKVLIRARSLLVRTALTL